MLVVVDEVKVEVDVEVDEEPSSMPPMSPPPPPLNLPSVGRDSVLFMGEMSGTPAATRTAAILLSPAVLVLSVATA